MVDPGGERVDGHDRAADGQPSLRDWLYAEEDGGELARAQWPDGLTGTRPSARSAFARSRKTASPRAGTVISLVATHYFGTVG